MRGSADSQQTAPVPSRCLEGHRVVVVLSSLLMGGAERQAMWLAPYLADHCGARVQVWGLDKGAGPVADLCRDARIPWLSIGSWSHRGRILRTAGLGKFAAMLRRHRIDALVPYTAVPCILSSHAARLARVPVCAWNQRDEGRADLRTLSARIALRNIAYFTSNSHDGLEFLVKAGVPREHIAFIRNGVQLAEPRQDRAAWRRRLDVRSDAVVACMLGNLHPAKDHRTLIHAWRRVVDAWMADGPPPVLVLAGRKDDTYPPSRALARELGVSDWIRFAGPVADVAGLLGASDMGVFSSHKEGCPNGVLECMASSLAVAATDLRGVRDAVGRDGQGYLSRPGDPVGLSRNVLALARDAALRRHQGELHRLRIDRCFSVERMRAAMTRPLVDALNRRRTAAPR